MSSFPNPELQAFAYPTFRGELVNNFQIDPLDIPNGHGGRSFRISKGAYLTGSQQQSAQPQDPREIFIDPYGYAVSTYDSSANWGSTPPGLIGLPKGSPYFAITGAFGWSNYALANPSILPSGDLPIATWSTTVAGTLRNLQDIRPSYISSIPVTNPGITEVVTGDVTKRATLQNSYYIPSNLDTQPRGKLFIGAGTCKVDNTTTVPWNGAGSPNYFYLGPFIRNGHVCGSTGSVPLFLDPAIPSNIAGIAHVYLDYPNGLPTFDDPVFTRMTLANFVTTFPLHTFPLAVVLLDSIGGIWKVIDCRPNYITS